MAPRTTPITACGGFTLVEMLVALIVAGIAATAMIGLYRGSSRAYADQEQVVALQQSLRAAFDRVARDLRSAGFDPQGSGRPGIAQAAADGMSFTRDLDRDGATSASGENLALCLYRAGDGTPCLGRTSGDGRDGDGDGTPDVGELGTGHGSFSHQPLVRHIEAAEFYYTLEDGSRSTAPGDPAQVRAVTLTLLGRTARPDPQRRRPQSFTTPSGATWTYDDGYRRLLMSETVRLRNIGL